MDTEVSLGAWITRRRKGLDLTREQLASCAGYSLSTLRKIESDERRPSRELAERLAECLHVAADERVAFIRAARGQSLVERLGTPLPPGPPASLAPPRSSSRLPAWPTPLVGREAELTVLARLLSDPQCRLLTLVGPGGVGKTRLAAAAASAQRQAYADGVFFVPLASVGSPEMAVSAVASAIDFDFAGSADPLTQLLGYLCSRQVLLVLDNIEHLLGPAVLGLVAELLEAADNTRLLVTTRTVLGLQGEWVFEVQGLPVPAAEEIEASARYSAVDLFLQSARRAMTSFEPGAGDLADIVRICRLVGGLPLGIELAATWVRALSCREIAEEIERDIGFLASSARNVPERHRSMCAVFDHSWRLLTGEERRALQQLSVFQGGFQREAAEAVTGARLPLLAALVDKSLLRHSSTGRYDLHELVRQYATDCLQADPEEARAVRDRHCQYFLTLLGERESPLQSNRQKDILAELNTEIGNLRQAWESAGAEQIVLVRQADFALWFYYELRNLLQEGEACFQGAIVRLQALGAGDGPQAASREVLLSHLEALQAPFLFRQGRLEEAQGLLRHSLARLRQGTDTAALVDALGVWGSACWLSGEFEEALHSCHEAYALAGPLRRRWQAATNATLMGAIEHELGHYAEAYHWLSEGLTQILSVGDPRAISFATGLLSRTAQVLGRSAETAPLSRQALQLTRATGDRFMIGLSLENLAQLADEPSEARRLYEESVALYREFGDQWSLTRTLVAYGYALEAWGEEAQARLHFKEALNIALAARLQVAVLDALIAIATLQACHQVNSSLLSIVMHVLQHPAATHDARERAERLRAILAAELTPEQVAAAEAGSGPEYHDAIVAQALA